MSLLTQNSKMKISSGEDVIIYDFAIPAYESSTGLKTCPNAGSCAAFCYARQGTYNFRGTKAALETRLKVTQTNQFIGLMQVELEAIKIKNEGKKILIRIHSAGDFYSEEYLAKWNTIINANPDLKFYAYTKMIKLMTGQERRNFRVIFSYGGTEDGLIDAFDFHAKVFKTEELMKKAGYINGTETDLVAALGENPKVGLVVHGNKKISTIEKQIKDMEQVKWKQVG